MSGMSDYSAKGVLNWLAGAVAMPVLPAIFLALFTTAPIDAGTGGTEVSGGAYARVQVAGSGTTNGTTASGNAVLHFATTPAWVTAGMYVYDTTAAVIPANTTVLSFTGTTVTLSANATAGGVGSGDTIVFSAFSPSGSSAPSTLTNNSIITFATPTANWGTIVAVGLYDALTSGNLLNWDYMGNFAWLPCSVSSASPGVITAKANGYTVGDTVVFSTEYGGTAPSFSASNFTGLLAVAHQATDTLDVTNAATAVNTSSTGSGMIRKVGSQVISTNVVASFAASALTLSLA